MRLEECQRYLDRGFKVLSKVLTLSCDSREEAESSKIQTLSEARYGVYKFNKLLSYYGNSSGYVCSAVISILHTSSLARRHERHVCVKILDSAQGFKFQDVRFSPSPFTIVPFTQQLQMGCHLAAAGPGTDQREQELSLLVVVD